MKGSQARFSKWRCTTVPEEDSYPTNSTDPDEMPHNVAFHLVLHRLPKNSFKRDHKRLRFLNIGSKYGTWNFMGIVHRIF